MNFKNIKQRTNGSFLTVWKLTLTGFRHSQLPRCCVAVLTAGTSALVRMRLAGLVRKQRQTDVGRETEKLSMFAVRVEHYLHMFWLHHVHFRHVSKPRAVQRLVLISLFVQETYHI